MKIENITIKDDNKIYKAEVPVDDTFTGNLVLKFHWIEGKLLRVDVNRNAQVEIVYPKG